MRVRVQKVGFPRPSLLVALLFLAAGLPAQERKRVVRVGSGFSAPWSYVTPDGTPSGFYIDVLKEAARREGVAFEAVLRRGGPERALFDGAVDLWAAAVPTDERRKHLYYTEPWWSQEHYLAVLAGGPIYGPRDLAGRVVLHAISPPFTADLRKVLPGAVLRPMDDLESRFAAVCDGKAAAALFYHERTLFALTSSGMMEACRQQGLRMIPVGQPVMEVSIAALPENQELADRLRARISEMAKDETLARLAAFPLTGNENLLRLLEEKKSDYQRRLVVSALFFLAAVLGIAVLAIFRLRRANRQTREALAMAEKALDVKREFLATISHEIRTPMTAVLGYMNMLMGTRLRHDQRRFAVEVTRATEALLTVMTTMLSYGRPGEIEGVLAVDSEQTLEPAAVMDDCISTILLAAEAKGLAVTLDVHPDVPRVLRGNPVLLRQAILNLLSNAVKFTMQGWVRLQVTYAESQLKCQVSDSGTGIPEEKWGIIFEPFTQVDSTDKRSFGGVGLGLAIVAENCRRLGGDVQVVRDPEGGARFTVRIPYEAVEGEGRWLPQGAEGTAVLLARPDEAVEIFAQYLHHAGMTVARCGTLAAWQDWSPPSEGRILAFVQGEEFGAVLPPWRNSRTEVVLTGSLHYLHQLDERSKAEFHDVLPLPAASQSVVEILQPAARTERRELLQINRKILVADDNAVNRRVLSALLEKLGCQVDVAKNGREAVEAALRERYAAILMDCQMPELNGFEATEEIRRHPLQAGEVPICGISASLDEETRTRCEASGMNEYLPKPVTISALHDLLTRITARQIIADNL